MSHKIIIVCVGVARGFLMESSEPTWTTEEEPFPQYQEASD